MRVKSAFLHNSGHRMRRIQVGRPPSGGLIHFLEVPMLHSLLPKAYHKFLSLPLLGPIADGFDDWLAVNGYTRVSRKHAIHMLRRVDAALRRRQVKEFVDLTHPVLHDCWMTLFKTDPGNAGTVHTLERYMVSNGLITDDRQAKITSPASILSK